MEHYNIILLDDHKMVASSMALELEEQGMHVLKVLTDPALLEESIHIHQPDLLIMDIRMGKYNGMTVSSEIKKKYPKVKIILISGYNLCYLAKDCGADGFCSKSDSIVQLIEIIMKVMKEDVTIFSSNEMNKKILTQTETKVLRLISEDKTRKEIAKQLFVSEKTITNHITSIIRKLEVRSRAGALSKGYELGIIHETM